ncbi:MAG: aldo/keto reductase [Bacteroidales bacterium]|nr:aldo/keto reductase [Bacteroidales bacterium]
MLHFTLNNQNKIPSLGLGTYKITKPSDVDNAIESALKNNFTLIDTAEIYANEQEIGNSLKKFGAKRYNLFITSKVWNSEQGYETTLRSFERTLKKLQTDYLDLYLIHWPKEKSTMLETWRAMEKLYNDGRVKNIGVSNFHVHHLEQLFKTATVIPAVNQIELHPYLTQKSLTEFCKKNDIVVEAWSPIAKGSVANDSLLQEIGKKHNKTAVQVVLRWHIQRGLIAIPKSTNTSRITQSIDIFDFELSADEMNQICGLNKNMRVGPDPDNFNF